MGRRSSAVRCRREAHTASIRGCDVSVESYVGMYCHSIIGQHALVNALPDGRCDRLRGGRIDKKRPGLEDEHHSSTEISATAALIGG